MELGKKLQASYMVSTKKAYSTEKFFIIGIGGSGMSSIAKYLIEAGCTVVGYDQRKSQITNQLLKLNIDVTNDLNYEIPEGSVVISSSAITSNNELLIQAENKGISVISRPDFLSNLTKQYKTIGVAGTHGKTTTTALLSHIYQYNNIDCSYIFGGMTSYSGIGGHFGNSSELVLESDEAFKTYLNFEHDNLIVTNIDDDHVDHYGSFDLLIESFLSVIKKTKLKPILNIDDNNLYKISQTIDSISYGRNPKSEYRYLGNKKIIRKGTEIEMNPRMPGDHFMMNSLAALANAEINGFELDKTVDAINTFTGVKRRTELIGTSNGISIYDDYGHHPTEMEATINAIKAITKGKLYVIFQPHRYTRTKLLFDRFMKPLSQADEVYILDIYSAGEPAIPGISTKILLERGATKNVNYADSTRSVIDIVSAKARTGDTVLTLGAGDITLVAPKIMEIIND